MSKALAQPQLKSIFLHSNGLHNWGTPTSVNLHLLEENLSFFYLTNSTGFPKGVLNVIYLDC
jgi:hypothetical protein